MEKEMAEKIENLRWTILEKGQKTRDKMKVAFDVVVEAPEGVLQLQMLKDFQREYKFYDALAMWLGQSKFWNDLENAYLILLAETYLVESDCNGGQREKGGKTATLLLPEEY